MAKFSTLNFDFGIVSDIFALYNPCYEVMKNILQQYQNLGWYLTSIDGYNLNGQAMYAAIWEQENSPDTRKITIAKSWNDFQQEWNENVASGRFDI